MKRDTYIFTKNCTIEIIIIKTILVPLQGGHCFKLRGRPWASRDLGPEANAGLHLLVFICEQFERLGWKLLCSLDCGSKINDDDEFHL